MTSLLLLLALPHAPSYARDVRPFLVRYCIECHAGANAEADLSLDSFAGLIEGGKRGPGVVPGKPDQGTLLRMVEGKLKPVMPPRKSKQPSAAEKALLRAWVLAGAKNDGPGKLVLPAIAPRKKVGSPVLALALRGDGERLAASVRGGAAQFKLPSGELTSTTKAPGDRVTALAWSPVGRLALACGVAGDPWQVRLGGKTLLKHNDAVQALAFSPDGSFLASAGYDRLIKLYDVAQREPGHVLKDHSDSVYAIAFRPDGKLLASGGADRAVKVWDVATGTRLYTLGESTDWVYAVAWSPDGKRLAAAGVDRSIRIWQADREGGKIVRSAFAHEGPILHLCYSKDGKSLYSLSEDRTAKRWDAVTLTERKVYPRFSEAPLSLAVSPDDKRLYVGLYDGRLLSLDAVTGKPVGQLLPVKPKPLVDRFPTTTEIEPNDSRSSAQAVALPLTINGASNRAGDVDWYAFDARAGDEIGITTKVTSLAPVLTPVLTLTDAEGNILAESGNGLLGHRAAKAGRLALRIRDREYRGGAGMNYKLHIGPIPLVTSLSPLGVQRGTTARIIAHGVNLGKHAAMSVTVPKDAVVGAFVTVRPRTEEPPLGKSTVVVGEFPEVSSGEMPVPGTANGVLDKAGSSQVWKFKAKKGEQLVIETNAARLGSPLDTSIEILDAAGKPLPRAVLRSIARTYTVFRDNDSRTTGIRIEAWSELAVNDWIFVGNELLRIRALPRNPDDDCRFFDEGGQRRGYLGTTPSYVSQGSSMNKVTIHPPGTKFPPNGLPLTTLFWRNDDGPGLGRDSRLDFDPPADGTYQIRVRDARGQRGPDHAYRLTVRQPRPDFAVSMRPASPTVFAGGAVPVTIDLKRIDGFAGVVEVELLGLPKGLNAPRSNIQALDTSTSVALYAEPGTKLPAKLPPLRVVARSVLAGKAVERSATGGKPKLAAGGDLRTTTEKTEVTLVPGGTARLTVRIERRNGFAGRVPVEVSGLPHGVRVLDVGLNGILIIPGETKRTFVLQADPWVRPMEHPLVVFSRREGKPGQFAAKSVLLKVTGPK